MDKKEEKGNSATDVANVILGAYADWLMDSSKKKERLTEIMVKVKEGLGVSTERTIDTYYGSNEIVSVVKLEDGKLYEIEIREERKS